jgi:hypothetical protein
MRRGAWLALLLAVGCGSTRPVPGGPDLASVMRDAGVSLDLAAPTACAPVDPMDDGQVCGTGCAAGLVPVSSAGGCRCFHVCDPARPTACPCPRRCAALSSSDGGAAGGACLPANGPGERCGLDPAGMPYGAGGCAQGTTCVNEDAAGLYRYCVYDCAQPTDCPKQTSCLELKDGAGAVIGHACALNSSDNGNRSLGQPCSGADVCPAGALCDTTCRPQCDAPSGACGAGSCTALVDGSRTVGYVCK